MKQKNSKNSTYLVLILAAVAIFLLGYVQSSGITGEAKNPLVKTQCNDGVYNDGYGYCDYLTKSTRCRDGSLPGDADCASKEDNKELPDCEPVPERCDGFDNNCNGQADENLSIACSTAGDCGQSGWTGTPYCGGDGNVHREFTSYACSFPGTCSSSCSSQTVDYVYQWCSNWCLSGQCLPSGNQTNSTG